MNICSKLTFYSATKLISTDSTRWISRDSFVSNYVISHWPIIYVVSHWSVMYVVSHWPVTYVVFHWPVTYVVSHWSVTYVRRNEVRIGDTHSSILPPYRLTISPSDSLLSLLIYSRASVAQRPTLHYHLSNLPYRLNHTLPYNLISPSNLSFSLQFNCVYRLIVALRCCDEVH